MSAVDRQRERAAKGRRRQIAERALRADHEPQTLHGLRHEPAAVSRADQSEITNRVRATETQSAYVAQRRIAEQMLRDADEFRRLGVDHDLSVTVRSVERQVNVMIRKLDEASR